MSPVVDAGDRAPALLAHGFHSIIGLKRSLKSVALPLPGIEMPQRAIGRIRSICGWRRIGFHELPEARLERGAIRTVLQTIKWSRLLV